MAHYGRIVPHGIMEGGREGELHTVENWVQFCMFYLACEMHPFFMFETHESKIRGPPRVLHFKKIRNGGHKDVRMDTNKSKGFL